MLVVFQIVYNQIIMKSLRGLKRYYELEKHQRNLLNHKIYGIVRGQQSMKVFMESHVFAVWDFMLLLKQLQRKLTSVQKIWIPVKNGNTARFINQIVVGEETDVHPFGKGHVSHFELYIEAMEEVCANTKPIRDFINNIQQGKNIIKELQNPQIPSYARKFVLNTLQAIDKPTPYVASQFFFGREDPIPQMFQKFVNTLQGEKKCEVLKYYLERHIKVDGEDHGPLAEKLLEELAQREDPKYELILDGAINAVSHRVELWDGIYQDIVRQAQEKKFYSAQYSL